MDQARGDGGKANQDYVGEFDLISSLNELERVKERNINSNVRSYSSVQ